ncbi:NlpC/P60 family protein [Curtobacterium flaccumfaciens pv. oortii]|uniref:C40 family peptidase n=1 Tax=Curtobacterium flaccumfaciens TaxID=2035 RepID=UPI00265ABEB4|nr:NlpC/P60 family protein [Curtobacterium flaccumfaciens]MCS5524791.1 NlpC/P60 family protein [Curtobacterium flaccumfaciens pv. oortii]
MKKWIGAIAGAAAVVIVLPGVLFLGGLSSYMGFAQAAKHAKSSCTTSDAGGAPGGSSGGSGLPSGGETALPAAQVGDMKLTSTQMSHAGSIIAVGQGMGVSSRGIQVALMVALQESTLRNLANTTVAESMALDHDGTGHDHDSVGLFQQRANWGTVAQRMDPAYEARAFFGGPLGPNGGTPAGLLDIPNWQTRSLAGAAQAVQVSKFPEAYAKWEDEAAAIMKARNVTVTSDTTTPTDTTLATDLGSCDTSTDGDTGGGTDAMPAADTSGASWTAPNGKSGVDVVNYAEQFVGKVPYSSACGSAGSPSAGWCCTGFVYYMYHQVLNIDLPSPVVSGQLAMSHQIPASEAKAGDLVAWVGHHIGIYDGHGGLIHSPDYGRNLTHAKSYQFQIGGVSPTFWRVNAIGGAS